MTEQQQQPIPEDILDEFAEMNKKFKHYYNGDYGLISVQADDVHLTYEAFVATFAPEGIRMLDRNVNVEDDESYTWSKELWVTHGGTRFFCLATTSDVEALIARGSEGVK